MWIVSGCEVTDIFVYKIVIKINTIMKFIRFILDLVLIAVLGSLLYVRYQQRVAEEGAEPTWECPICHEEVTVVSDHYVECGKAAGQEFIDKEVLLKK